MLNTLKKNKTFWITLNNPQTSNSITYPIIDRLVAALDEAERDDEIRVVVITGEGKNFSSGGDLNNMMNRSEMFQGEGDELRRRYELGIQRISKSIEQFTKPIIAAVNGAAAGAGCDLACMCDIRIGGTSTVFLESFVKIGLVPGDGGTFFLQRVIGYSRAMEMTLTGRKVGASEAQSWGLLNAVVPDDQILFESEKWADLICENAPRSVQMSKKAMKISYLHDLNTTLDLLAAYQGLSQRTRDHELALQALKNKLKPEFTGK